ncbi:hypothetical protein GH714_033268 [Hevea brasiliensis]|uniref:Phospholipase A1 n=1 Tax=Hevea brasiliensis TaxID=3981 RepID=A0A6A6N889_HEVBR|nr:hypothetical protein GH714_033268 [Hevea brasiliensis]
METPNPQEPTWPEILGGNNWESLLDPLDLTVRKLVLRCGDFCQATYDSFNNDQNSKYCGTSRYGKNNFFQKVMLEDAENYRVSSFLYGTARVSLPEAFLLHSMSRESWDRESNWIGYISVTSDEYTKVLGRREIYIVFRGTTRNYEWVDILGAKLHSALPLLRGSSQRIEENNSSSDSDNDDDEKVPKVMLGWLTIYISDDPKSPFTKLSARQQLLTKINQLREQYRDDNLSVILTGHSLGASLSILAAFDLVENGITDIPVAALSLAAHKLETKPSIPGRLLGYRYTGTELEIDTRKSPNLKDSKNPSDWHNLQAMLHIVAGWNGEKGEFKLRVKRSLALVNKSCEFLKNECMVPGSWWIEKNKGMVRGEDGEWTMASPDEEDQPVPEI